MNRSKRRPFRYWPSILVLLVGSFPRPAAAVNLTWKGHTWQVTSGSMAGVCKGDPNNVSVDSSGYLHFKIVNTGGTWTASEMFTTDNLGFGTYQWQVDGPVDSYDKNIVLGLFPYGPAANIGADGTNEIDIEYSRWGQATGPNADWTDYPNSGTTVGELSFNFTLSSTLSTSRFIWTAASIQSFLIDGLQPVDSTAGLIKSWTYAPTNPSTNIPQSPMPLGMNLWCFDAPPSNGQPIEIVIRDFQFVPAGTGGAGGTTGTGGVGGRAGAGGTGGTGGVGGRAGAGGTTGMGGVGGRAGAGGTGGTGGVGGRAGAGGAGGDGGRTGAGGLGGLGGDGGRIGAGGATGAGGEGGTIGAASGGSSGAGGATGSAGAAGHASGAASAGGCSCGVVGDAGPSGGAPALLLLLALVFRRRRSTE